MSAKTIALYQAHLAAQGRAPKQPINIMGTQPRTVRINRSKKPKYSVSGLAQHSK